MKLKEKDHDYIKPRMKNYEIFLNFYIIFKKAQFFPFFKQY